MRGFASDCASGPNDRRRPASIPTVSGSPQIPFGAGLPGCPIELVAIFDFDGTMYTGDLPIQAFARHLAERLPEPAGRSLIAGMRNFLEQGEFPGAPAVDLSAAQDGYEAVEILGTALGLTDGELSNAYRASRRDLAAAAFAVDAAPGLSELLTEWQPRAHIAVVTNADREGVAEVLESTGLAALIHETVIDAGKPAGLRSVIDRTLPMVNGDASRIVAVGDRWHGDLEPLHLRGGRTALIDRFERRLGSPDFTGPDLAAIIPSLREWAAGLPALTRA